jgi:spermidine/putrescine transport system permease protein
MTTDIANSRLALTGLRLFYALLVVFLYAPILLLAIFSFNDNPTPAFPLSNLTLRWYQQFLSNQQLIGALRNSMVVATISSVIAVALGLAASFLLVRRRFVGKNAVSALVLSPLVIPYLVFGIALLILFSALDEFLTNTLGVYIGLGLHAVVIGHVVVSLPYTILTIVPRLERMNISLEEASRDLGAGSAETFRRVTLPLLVPSIVSSFLIAFTLSFDEFAIASFLTARSLTWPVYLFAQLRFPVLLPQLIAVSVIVMTLSIAVVVATEAFRRRAERRLDFAPPA